MKPRLVVFASVLLAMASVIALWRHWTARHVAQSASTPTEAASMARPGSAEASCCEGDKPCAAGRARALEKLARRDDTKLVYYAMTLAVALEGGNCDAATEIARGMGPLVDDLLQKQKQKPDLAAATQLALRGRTEYCGRGPRRRPEAPPDDAIVTMSRTACEGTCPVYTVTATASGAVRWVGTRFVTREGEASRSIPKARARELFDALEYLRFASMVVPPSTIDDAAGVTLTVVRDGRTHRIKDEAACFGRQSFDSLVCYLELLVDDVAETAPWAREPTLLHAK